MTIISSTSPQCWNSSTVCSRLVRPAIGTNCLGMSRPMRAPTPPARMTATLRRRVPGGEGGFWSMAGPFIRCRGLVAGAGGASRVFGGGWDVDVGGLEPLPGFLGSDVGIHPGVLAHRDHCRNEGAVVDA